MNPPSPVVRGLPKPGATVAMGEAVGGPDTMRVVLVVGLIAGVSDLFMGHGLRQSRVETALKRAPDA